MDPKRTRSMSTRSSANQKFKQQKLSNVDVSKVYSDKYNGTGTFESPVSIDDDDDDDDIQITHLKSSGNNIDNNNNNNSSNSNNSSNNNSIDSSDQEEDIKEIIKPKETITVDPDNIYLSPLHVKVGQYNQNPIDQVVAFKENQIEITIPFHYLSPNTTLLKKENVCLVELPYKNIKEFVVSCFKTVINIDILLSEFIYKKLWLTKIFPLKNFESGITNSISFLAIPRDQFEAMKSFIEKKSSNLRLSMEIQDHSKMDKVIAIYPHVKSTKQIVNNKDVVKITYSDKARLEPSHYLNDSIIDFYIRYIKDNYVLDGNSSKFYFFNTFFYNIIGSQTNMHYAYQRISKWTKNVDIFCYDFLFIPICQNSHWTLLIVTFPNQDFETATEVNKPLIIFLDSLNSQSLLVITKKIRDYLTMEWKHKKSDPSKGKVQERVFNSKNLPLVRANVPKQDNLFDCGVFLLHYIELFCRNPETNFNDPLNRPNWFTCSDITEKREKIKHLIEVLEAEQSAEEENTLNTTLTTSTTSTTTSTPTSTSTSTSNSNSNSINSDTINRNMDSDSNKDDNKNITTSVPENNSNIDSNRINNNDNNISDSSKIDNTATPSLENNNYIDNNIINDINNPTTSSNNNNNLDNNNIENTPKNNNNIESNTTINSSNNNNVDSNNSLEKAEKDIKEEQKEKIQDIEMNESKVEPNQGDMTDLQKKVKQIEQQYQTQHNLETQQIQENQMDNNQDMEIKTKEEFNDQQDIQIDKN